MELQTILNRPPNVLVADDDKNIREMLQAHLEISGCRVIPAGSGDEALEELGREPVDSVMLLTRARSLLRLRRLHLDLQERNELLARALHRYVSRDVAETILAEPDRYLKLGGESRRVTVLFADIKGFVRFTASHSSRGGV